MQYGSPLWQPWVLGEEEGIKHIKYAYVFLSDARGFSLLTGSLCSYEHGIQTFDTANVGELPIVIWYGC